MKYYLLKPEVAGELGNSSKVIYEEGRIKEVTYLEFVFLGWLGDEILKARPCYIITKNIMNDFESNKITGIRYEDIQMTFSDEFFEFQDDISEVPPFVRIVPLNKIDDITEGMSDDIYLDKYNRLIFSERALTILKKYRINNCDIEQL